MGVPHLVVCGRSFNAGVPYADLCRTKYGDKATSGNEVSTESTGLSSAKVS